jgi:hypothetical protein
MRPNQQNKFIRFILRSIDLFVSLYLHRSVHWEREPFQKASPAQWRAGWLFVACLPIPFLVVSYSHSIGSFLDHAGDANHSILWLYVALIGFALIEIFVWFKIGPKVPLYFSIPTAIGEWIYCIWLLGFHLERLGHPL